MLRPVPDLRPGRDEDARQIGGEAQRLGLLARAGLPAARAWVVDRRLFDAMAKSCLPPGHELRALVRRAAAGRGARRCAVAWERMRTAPLPPALGEAVAAFWHELGPELPLGIALRPSLAADRAPPPDAPWCLPEVGGVRGTEQILDAVRRVWSSALLSCAVSRYAELGLRDVGVAVLLQEELAGTRRGRLWRGAGPGAGLGPGQGWVVGWEQGAGQEAAEARLAELGVAAERCLGASHVLHVVLPDAEPGAGAQIVAAQQHARALGGAGASTCWVELRLGRLPAPHYTPLSRSVVEHTAHHALDEALGSLGCRLDPDDALFAGLHGRSFLNATALGASLARLPFAAGEALSLALGAAAAAPPGAAPWPSPLAAAACVAQPLRFERGGAALGHALEREARPLSELQVALLPDDALATTLGHAQELLRRAAGLWSRRAAIELLYQAALTALLRRRLPEVRRSAVLALVAGNPGMHYPALGRALVRVARSLAHDERAAERLCSGEPCSPGELPAGPGRSALGDFLWAYRDDCLAPFELDRPRWGEEPGEVIAMLRALVPAVAAGGGVRPQGCEAPGLARARADGELARYEPLLSLPERGALRLLMGRSRRLARLEPSLEPLVLRALAIMRRTVLDVDRRLRRTEPSIEPGGAWLCRAGELGRALSTGRPELGRLIRMRAAERTRELVASPPPCFVGAPPPGPLAPAEAEPLGGLGVSPGVAEGRARLADPATGLPARIEPGDVLVLHGAAGGLAPLCAVAGALIIEIGGALSPACAVAREYGLAAVAGVRAATLRLREGERVRVDGERGRVERLEPA